MFPLVVALGIAVVVTILVSPLFVARLRLDGSIPLGTACVALSLGLASIVASLPRGSFPGAEAVFPACFSLLLIGAFLILRDDRGDDGGEPPDAEPPWWPEFEAGYRQYVREERRRRVRR